MANKGSHGTTLRTVFQRVKHSPIFYNDWEQNNEKLFLGESRFDVLTNHSAHGPHWEGVYVHLKRYLIEKSILEETYTNQRQSFSKAVWLTDSFFKDGDFKYPICTHYNPRYESIQVHPGASRNVIYHLFGFQNRIKFFYFATNGKMYDFIESPKLITEDDLHQMEKDGYEIAVSADHGAFIPHITFDGGQTTGAGAVWHTKCREVLNNRKLYINSFVEELEIFDKTNNKGDADLVIEIKKELNLIEKIRISYLAFLNYNYENDYMSITPKNPSQSKLDIKSPL